MQQGDVNQAVFAHLERGQVAPADLAIDDAFFEARELGETLDGHQGHMGRDLGRFVLFHIITCLWWAVIRFEGLGGVMGTIIRGTITVVYTTNIV